MRRLPRVVVTGAGGQLGSDLLAVLSSDLRAGAFQGLSRQECDIADLHRVRKVIHDQARAAGREGLVVVNAAAYTDVDGAESDEAGAWAVNATGPAHLAMWCGEVGATLVHLSTDYVFAGDKAGPYEVGDATGPKSVYGRTKLAGEEAVRELLPEAGYVVRTAWVYGAVGRNFVKTMVRLSRERDTLSVVDDQRGSPTWSADLARGLVELIDVRPPAAIYHCTNAGDTTWCGFTRAIFEELGLDPARVQPTTTDAFPRPAPRPANSVLSPASWLEAGLPPMRDWRDALRVAFAEIGDALRA